MHQSTLNTVHLASEVISSNFIKVFSLKMSSEIMKNYTESDTEEDDEDYKKGGYHPVRIGDVYHGRYRILRKLGFDC
jgi:hypothetical protein